MSEAARAGSKAARDRGLRIIADEYTTRVAAGEKAPVTAIAKAHDLNKSTASRWIKEGKRRGYIKE